MHNRSQLAEVPASAGFVGVALKNRKIDKIRFQDFHPPPTFDGCELFQGRDYFSTFLSHVLGTILDISAFSVNVRMFE